jgi:hypothetical protein
MLQTCTLLSRRMLWLKADIRTHSLLRSQQSGKNYRKDIAH